MLKYLILSLQQTSKISMSCSFSLLDLRDFYLKVVLEFLDI